MKTDAYTNLFSELGYPQSDIDRKLSETWYEVFEGPRKLYFETDDGMGYMCDTGNNDARSEGMSYGMMMAVQMNRQDVFDRIWKWTKKYMYMTEGIHQGYFAWSCGIDGTRNSYGPAPDGEEYFAMALFFASHRWGDREEPFNYERQAQDILRCCVHNGEMEKTRTEHDHPATEGRKTGFSMWDPDNYLIKFVPELDFTDPSYHLPHFYDLFALWAYPEDRGFWKKAANASRKFLPTACHPLTGFAPEYSGYDGKPHPFNAEHMGFYSDSYRVAANIGLDAEWFGKKAWQKDIADRIQHFFADIPLTDWQYYSIDGIPGKRDYVHNIGLLATNAMAALATGGPVAEKTVRLFWDTPMRTDGRRYYDNCLYLFAVLALSGNYRIW